MRRAPLSRAGVPLPTPQQAQPIPQAAPGAGLAPQTSQGQRLERIDQLKRIADHARHEFPKKATGL